MFTYLSSVRPANIMLGYKDTRTTLGAQCTMIVHFIKSWCFSNFLNYIFYFLFVVIRKVTSRLDMYKCMKLQDNHRSEGGGGGQIKFYNVVLSSEIRMFAKFQVDWTCGSVSKLEYKV